MQCGVGMRQVMPQAFEVQLEAVQFFGFQEECMRFGLDDVVQIGDVLQGQGALVAVHLKAPKNGKT